CVLFVYIFFFQAEDGIRDSSVTGVQTCALPIFLLQVIDVGRLFLAGKELDAECANLIVDLGIVNDFAEDINLLVRKNLARGVSEIGRASCRERVQISGWGGAEWTNSVKQVVTSW